MFKKTDEKIPSNLECTDRHQQLLPQPNVMTDLTQVPSIRDIHQIAAHFPLNGRFVDSFPYGSGHINDTLVVTYDQAGVRVRYIFQRINRHIFKDVPLLMNNIKHVTEHLAKSTQGDNRRALTLVRTIEGSPFYQTPAGDCWRVYLFIERARTYDELKSPAQAFEAARAFGVFQKSLADLPGEQLKESIPGFHNTRQRFEALRKAADENVAGCRSGVAAELDFAFRREASVDCLLDLAKSGTLPGRVTHNDTKINNVMLDETTGEGICVIDLDTVMPGLSLYDFGDMVRTATSPTAEDERDLSRIGVRMAVFEALARGFTQGAGAMLVEAEWENLVLAGKLMTFEVGIRFLTDCLQGDIYFKTKRPGHNLDRCRAQFRLVECLEECTEEMHDIVRGLREESAQK